MKKQRFKLPVGVHLVLRKDSKILLMKRSNTGYSDGLWSLPVGAIEGGETLVGAMVREAKEELDLSIDPEELKFLGIIHKLTNIGYENIGVFFECTLNDRAIKNNEPHKCSQIAFFDESLLPEDMTYYQRQFFINGKDVYLEVEEIFTESINENN